MIPVGQPYRPAGSLDARSILITTILGSTAAVLGAAFVWAWEWSPIPTLVILTPIAQGLGVGFVMAFAVGRLGMRHPRLVGTVGFACGLLSAVLVHYGHYIHLATSITEEIRAEVVQNQSIPEAKRSEILGKLDSDPDAVVDSLLEERTGYSGFLGSLWLRNEQGVQIKRMPVTGNWLWGLWGFEALVVAFAASTIPAGRASEPFCEDCGYWCAKEPDAFTLPAGLSAPLAEAIREDKAARVGELRTDPPDFDTTGAVGVTLHACPGCDQAFAEVSHRVSDGKNTRVTALLKPTRVSPEMTSAIRYEPAQAGPAAPEEAAEPGAGGIVDEPSPTA